MRNLLLSMLITISAAPCAHASERYFVVLFASQAAGAPPRQSHTFATFLKLDVPPGETPDPGKVRTQAAFTISWLPADGDIRLLQGPVPGRNYTLKESLEFAAAQEMTTTARGPFETSKDIYTRAVQQKAKLDSGAVAYKAMDKRFRPDTASNCIHAVSDILPGPPLDTGISRGDEATDLVAARFRTFLIEPQKTHPWALRYLDPNEPRIAQGASSKYGFTVLPPPPASP